MVFEPYDFTVIRPDVLYSKGVVDKKFTQKSYMPIPPGLSQLVFNEGLDIRLEPNRLLIQQQGFPLSEEDCEAPGIATRFVESFPDIVYTSVGINPRGFLDSAKSPRAGKPLVDLLGSKGNWLEYRNHRPSAQMKFFYNFEDKRITFDVITGEIERPTDQGSMVHQGTMYHANFHREIGETEQEARIAKLESIISLWGGDLVDFKVLMDKINKRREMA